MFDATANNQFNDDMNTPPNGADLKDDDFVYSALLPLTISAHPVMIITAPLYINTTDPILGADMKITAVAKFLFLMWLCINDFFGSLIP